MKSPHGRDGAMSKTARSRGRVGVPGTSSDPSYALSILGHRIANVIASRRLDVVGEPAREVIIKLGKPRPEADPSVWRCSYLVGGIPDERRRMARGADSLQALQCALQGAKATIAESGVVCTWNTEPGDIGIPYTVPTYEGSGFSQRMERMIEHEIEEFTRATREAKKGRLPP